VLDRVRGDLVGIDGTRLHALNEALADAEAMRITKAVVDPWNNR
jgi:hypothetical protein